MGERSAWGEIALATSDRDLLRSPQPPKNRTMTTLLKPSSILPQGLRLQQINNLTLFKFTDELRDLQVNHHSSVGCVSA